MSGCAGHLPNCSEKFNEEVKFPFVDHISDAFCNDHKAFGTVMPNEARGFVICVKLCQTWVSDLVMMPDAHSDIWHGIGKSCQIPIVKLTHTIQNSNAK